MGPTFEKPGRRSLSPRFLVVSPISALVQSLHRPLPVIRVPGYRPATPFVKMEQVKI